MADVAQLQAALVGADKAGDADGAKLLAAELRRLMSAGVPGPSAAERVANDPTSQGARNFAEEMSFPEQVAAGAGKGFRDIGRGIQQVLPGTLAISAYQRATGQPTLTEGLRKVVAEERQTDAPLMATPGGRVGELGANIAATVPALAIPGVNMVRGAAAVGGAMGLLQPSTSTGETALNTGLGTALGGAGQAVANKVVSATAPVLRNARDAILAKAQELGFVVSPSEGRGTVVNKLVTGLGNKQQTAQEMSNRNAGVLEGLAKKELGLPATETLEAPAFQNVRAQAYQQGYKPVEGLGIIRPDPQFEKSIAALAGKESQGAVTRAGQGDITALTDELKGHPWTGKGLVDDIRTLREEGASNLGKLKGIGEQQLGRAQLEAAKALEDLAERNLALNNAPADLIQNFRTARAAIAKAHTIEDAMQGGSSIDARKFAKNEADAKKLSPEMYAAWKFAKEFPKSTQPPSKTGGIPWNVIVPSSGLSALGYGASEVGAGSPAGAALGALPLLRGPARSIAASKLYQKAMVNPATATGPRLAAIAAGPAQRLQRIAPQVSTVTAMEVE